MTPNIYPSCTPELRVLERSDGVQILQVRQVNHTYGYVSKWQDVPVIKEEMVIEEK